MFLMEILKTGKKSKYAFLSDWIKKKLLYRHSVKNHVALKMNKL